MALTNWNNSNYLNRLSAVLNVYPMFISAWGYIATLPLGATSVVVNSGVSGSDDHQKRMNVNVTPSIEAFCRSTSNAAGASTAGPSAATWFHAAAEFIATNSRAALLNGANRGSDGTSVTVNNANSVYIGRNTTASNSWPATGALAEVSFWDCQGLTNTNMDSLAAKLYNGGAGGAGGNPININAEAAQPWTGKLAAYWPLTNTGDLGDASGHGYDLTMQGTLTNFASHPTIEAPASSGLIIGDSFTLYSKF